MDAIVITIGDEILLGQILDTNSQYIAKQLTRLGAEVVDILSVPDQGDKIMGMDRLRDAACRVSRRYRRTGADER